MQSVSSAFAAQTSAPVRNISASVLISFKKDFDAATSFLTIGSSLIGGSDIVKGDSNTLQEWDKYNYEDYSDRIISLEYDRETSPPTNPYTMAIATVVLDNHDDIFTPTNTSSPLYGYVREMRPIRIHVGFNNENIPVFVGLTEKKPEIDVMRKTATFRCVDFLHYIMTKPLNQELIYVGKRTDEILSALLQNAGLSTSQFDLDYGAVVIPFAYFKNDDTYQKAIGQICQAELGNLSMAENGRIRFQNRTNWYTNVRSWDLTDSGNTIERSNGTDDNIINVVSVTANARAVQAARPVYDLNQGQLGAGLLAVSSDPIAPGDDYTMFIDFKDDDGDLPVASATAPSAGYNPASSYYLANDKQDGTGNNSTNLVLSSYSLFSTGMKLVFHNNDSVPLYITDLIIWGTPAPVVTRIFQRIQDDTSVGDMEGFEEKLYEIKNDYIQDTTAATTISKIILGDMAQEQDQQNRLIIGIPQLQIGDVVGAIDDSSNQDYFVTRINGILNSSGFRQNLKLSKRQISKYFRIGISTIGGSDPLGP